MNIISKDYCRDLKQLESTLSSSTYSSIQDFNFAKKQKNRADDKCFRFSCGLMFYSIRLIRKPRSVIFQMEFQIRWNMIFMPTRPKSTTYLHDFSLWLFHTFFSNTYMFVVYYIHFWEATRNSINNSATMLKFFVILHFQMWSC